MKHFSASVTAFGSTFLEKLDFRSKRPLIFQRESTGITHGIEFIKHRDRFTAAAFWRITATPLGDNGSYQFYRRLGRFVDQRDHWFLLETELSKGFKFIEHALDKEVLPFFAQFGSIEAILEGVSSGVIDAPEAFGHDTGWMLFYQGFCRASTSDSSGAKECFTELIELDLGPQAKLDWVEERLRLATEALSELT